jgi:hypothetical protein
MDTADEGYVGCKETWWLCLRRQILGQQSIVTVRRACLSCSWKALNSPQIYHSNVAVETRIVFVYSICPKQKEHSNIADSSFPVFVSQFVDVDVWPTWCCPPWCNTSTDCLPWLADNIVHAGSCTIMLASQLEERRHKSTKVPWMTSSTHRRGGSNTQGAGARAPLKFWVSKENIPYFI